jgi:adenosylcobinamide-GDP ribazoletransferase
LAVTNALRLALGTLTAVPTSPPSGVDRRTGSWAMTLAPLVGAGLAVLAGLFLWLLGRAGAGLPDVRELLPTDLAASWQVDPALAAVLTIGLLALLTRAMHLDGLADTADGLGSGRAAEEALTIMRRGDVGPFGVVTLVLVLLAQVLALAELVAVGLGFPALLLALVVSRLALPLLCSRGVPSARRDGLGQVVAGSVSRVRLALAALVSLVLLVPLSSVSLGWDALEPGVVGRAGLVAGLALLAAWLLARRAVHRLGGVTGDVLGAGVEVAFTVTLVTLTLVT